MKISLDIIGAGQVVKGFLEKIQDQFLNVDIQVYTRNPQGRQRPISSFRPSQRIIIFCLSTDEEQILRRSKDNSRLNVALENLLIVKNLIKNFTLDQQFIFVLTNPSEIIAEFIYRKSKNKRVYALGLNTDYKRYASLLKSSVSVAGNHYDFPYPLMDSVLDEEQSVDLLNKELQILIKSEFNGYRPPVKSGVNALFDLLSGLIEKRDIFLSGYCKELNCFSGGIFNCDQFIFSPLLGNSVISKYKIASIANKHLDTYLKTIAKVDI